MSSGDQSCAFPGCERSGADVLRVHHVRHWAKGGETSKDNCILLCPRCHWLVHEGGFSVKGHAPDALVFENPAGRRLELCHQPPQLATDPVAALRLEHLEQGTSINGTTNLIDIWGEPMDLGFAVDCLLKVQEQRATPSVSVE